MRIDVVIHQGSRKQPWSKSRHQSMFAPLSLSSSSALNTSSLNSGVAFVTDARSIG